MKSWHTFTMPCANTSPQSFRDINSCNSPNNPASAYYYSPLYRKLRQQSLLKVMRQNQALSLGGLVITHVFL